MVKGDGIKNFFILPHHFIIRDEVIFNPDTLKIIDNCRIDYTRGTLLFQTPPDSGSQIRISYRYLPLGLKLSYHHWTVSDSLITEDSGDTVKMKIQKIRSEKQIQTGSNLRKSGSLFRGISLATNQGMRLESGLRMQISGEILPSVEVIASLTDQNLPIQPEGNTQKLQEIDKVFIKIKTLGFNTTMGDFIYKSGESQFANYSRKLKGAMGNVKAGQGSLQFMAASTKGEFTTNHFQGREGNQGPYQLIGRNGEMDIIVLAGTERVWIDGEQKQRGEKNDYTIEYGNGQIIFTRNCLITGDSRITVDFEYSSLKFQKEIYAVSGGMKFFKNHLNINMSYIREADDRKNPLDIIMTDEYKDVLKSAGDSADSAATSGAEYKGENKGNYAKADSAGNSYFKHAGVNNGDYNVRFSYVGQGNGDYSLQGYGIYRYEGQGKGAYVSVLYLPMPKSHQVADFSVDLNLGGGLGFGGEVGISDQDLNLYSSRDDKDNIDAAVSTWFRMDQKQMKLFGKNFGDLKIDGKISDIGENFRSPGRISEVEHGRKWGVSEGKYWGEKTSQITGSYFPFADFVLKGEAGTFRRGDFKSKRKTFFTEFNKSDYLKFNYKAELIETSRKDSLSGFWLRQQGKIQTGFFGLKPSLQYQGEFRKDRLNDSLLTGFSYDQWSGGLSFNRGFINGQIKKSIRIDDEYNENKLINNSKANTDMINLGLKISKALSADLMYTHRTRIYKSPDIEDKITDLADMKIKISPQRRYFEGSFYYKFSSTHVSEMVRDTIEVGRGLGMYRYDEDLDELVPDQDGDLIMRNIQTGNFLPVNNLRIGGDIRLRGKEFYKDPKGVGIFISKLRSKSNLRIQRREKDKNFKEVNKSIFNPKWGRDTTVVSARLSFYQDIEYTDPKVGLSVRMRFKSDNSEDHQMIDYGLVRKIREQSIRIKENPLDMIGIMAEYKRRREIKDYENKSRMDRDICAVESTVELSYRPKQSVEIMLKTKYSKAENFSSAEKISASSFFIVPGLRYSIRDRGHLKCEIEFGKVKTEPEGTILPYEMLSGDQPGNTMRWSLLFTYRISGHVMTTLNYRGRNEPWRDRVYQTGKVEVRMFF